MAIATSRLWESRNGCKHGVSAAAKQQAITDQTHRELRALYMLQMHVMPQDRCVFRQTVEIHLEEPVARIQEWIQYNKKLISFSVQAQRTQTQLKTKSIHQFFSRHGRIRSRIPKSPDSRPPRRQIGVPKRMLPTRMSNFFPRQATLRSFIPPIRENKPIGFTRTLQQTMMRSHIYFSNLFPDHPS